MRILLFIFLFIGSFYSMAVADGVEETRAKAEQGDAQAQSNLGDTYAKGKTDELESFCSTAA